MDRSRLTIVAWACGPDRPGGAVLAAAPFVYALAASALEVDVQMHFTSSAVRWLIDGVAAQAYTDRRRSRSVLDYLGDAQAAGIELYACSMALAEHRRDGEQLIAGVQIAGAATVIAAAVGDDRMRTLVF